MIERSRSLGIDSRIRIVALVVVSSVTMLVGGASFGFGHLGPHLLLWTLAIPIALGAFAISRACFSPNGFADACIRTSIMMIAVVVFSGLVLGAAGLISRTWYVLLEVLFVVTALVAVPPVHRSIKGSHLCVAFIGLWVAISAFVYGMGLGHAPFTAYDSLSYHLFFPARWLQGHRLAIIPTPFGDEASAYQPANGELWFLWLMLPFHGDFLARIGQFPFYVLGAAVVYALARQCGASARHAAYAPTFFLLAPPIVEQAVGPNVDLIHAVLFLASLSLGIVAVDTNARRDWALWGISTGLFLGTKYLALVYLPVLLAIPFVRGLRWRASWAVPGIVVFALPWYIRNWVVAGSPIYPATLRVAGITLGPGAYSRTAMTQSFLHATDPRLLLIAAIHAFGTTFALWLGPAIVIVTAMVVARRAWWPAGFAILATLAMFPLCWLNLGDNADSRFLLPAVVTAIGVLPLAFGTNRRFNAVLHAWFIIGIAWIVVGADWQLPASLPWYMADWLLLRGVVARPFLSGFIVLAAGTTILCWAVPRRWVGAVAGGLIAITGIGLAVGGERWCIPSRCDYLNVASPHLRLGYLYGSRWLTSNIRGATVAYTGINLPYPLSGSDLTNTALYVNIDRHRDWRFHEYAQSAASQSFIKIADHAVFARPSGLLMPARPREDRIDALRPRFERMSGSLDEWKANLRSRAVSYVFISTLDPYEIEYVWHNTQGFPIEDEWARSDPAVFRLVYENTDVRIYQVTAS